MSWAFAAWSASRRTPGSTTNAERNRLARQLGLDRGHRQHAGHPDLLIQRDGDAIRQAEHIVGRRADRQRDGGLADLEDGAAVDVRRAERDRAGAHAPGPEPGSGQLPVAPQGQHDALAELGRGAKIVGAVLDDPGSQQAAQVRVGRDRRRVHRGGHGYRGQVQDAAG
jgi:hypothetical protein